MQDRATSVSNRLASNGCAIEVDAFKAVVMCPPHDNSLEAASQDIPWLVQTMSALSPLALDSPLRQPLAPD